MKISVITVCYNSVSTIEDCIQSVLLQDHKDVEYILIDGGSTDGTADILERYKTSFSHYVSERDGGIYDAMNKGIQAANGDFVGILNSDDVYASVEELSQVAKELERNPDCSVLCGNIMFKDFESQKPIRFYSAARFKAYKLRFGWMPPHPGSFVKRTVYQRFGLYKTSFKIAADYERFVRWLWVEKLSYCLFDRTIVHMRVGGASTAGLKSRLVLNGEIIKACRDNGLYTNWALLVLKLPFKLLEYYVK